MSKKILFVIDMQNDFIDGSLGSEQAKKIVPNVVEFIKNWDKNQMIWYTLDTHFDKDISCSNEYAKTLEGKMLPIKHCIRGTEGWYLNKNVKSSLQNHPLHLVKTFTKVTFGSIDMVKEASLYLWQNVNSADEIHILGLCTDICVISNALLLRAQFPNLKIKCYRDCCAGTSKESHEAALKVMQNCQIEII